MMLGAREYVDMILSGEVEAFSEARHEHSTLASSLLSCMIGSLTSLRSDMSNSSNRPSV